MILETFLAALFYTLHIEVAGVVVFVYLIAFKLIITEDSLTAFLPFLLVGLFVLRLYDSYDAFMSLKFVMGVPAVLGVVFHFAYYRVRPQRGGLFYGYLAVAVALAFGGCFSISYVDLFSGSSLYYTYGLGLGLLLLYCALRPRLHSREGYDIREYVAKTAFYCAVFIVYMVAAFYIMEHELLASGATVVIERSGQTISAFANALNSMSNNLSTSVLLTMPFLFYLSRKGGAMGGVYFAVGVLEEVAALLTLSRGGMIFASAMCGFLVVFTLVKYREVRVRNAIVLAGILVLLGVLFAIFRQEIIALFREGAVPSSTAMKVVLALMTLVFAAFAGYVYYLFRCKSRRVLYANLAGIALVALVAFIVCLANWDKMGEIAVKLDYYRGNMMLIAAENFKTYPIFGTGMGYQGLQGIYAHKKGMFGCYHCLPVQVIGSMGLFGAAAYLIMLRERMRVLREGKDSEYAAVIMLSYLGLIYISLVDPGIFCPVVYGVQLAVYFISAESIGEALPSGAAPEACYGEKA